MTSACRSFGAFTVGLAIASLLLSACPSPRGAGPVKNASVPNHVRQLAVRRGVVSVIVDGQDPDWLIPWDKKRPWRRYLNGLVVPGNKILVYARYLAHNTLIQVDKDGESRTFEAQATLVDYEIPLALLEVKDQRFWQGLEPLSLAQMVPVEGEVRLNRWLSSGQFESTRGAIKQINVQSHFPGRSQLLTLDVSSPMTGAGWGEIVMKDGQVIGLTTSSSDDQQTVLTSPILRQFLSDAQNQPYRGIARHSFTWQPLGNPALRKHLGLKPKEGGVRVRSVLPHGGAAGALEPGDVILKIGDAKINERGQFVHPAYGRLYFGVLWTDGRHPQDKLPLQVMRNGERKEIAVGLKRMKPSQDVIPNYDFENPPEFLEVGGLVFQPLTVDYLRTWSSWFQNAPLRMVIEYNRRGQRPKKPNERVVILSRVLADPVNLGYQDFQSLIVDSVNGRPINSMNDLKDAIAHPKGGFHVVEFLPGQHQQRLVLDAAKAEAAEAGLRSRYGLQ